jgi:hypothetical protein
MFRRKKWRYGGNIEDRDGDRGELVEQKVGGPGIVNRFVSGVRPLTYLIFDGVFDRNPGLKMVAAEVNCGWVPFWSQTMDHTLETEGAWELSGTWQVTPTGRNLLPYSPQAGQATDDGSGNITFTWLARSRFVEFAEQVGEVATALRDEGGPAAIATDRSSGTEIPSQVFSDLPDEVE